MFFISFPFFLKTLKTLTAIFLINSRWVIVSLVYMASTVYIRMGATPPSPKDLFYYSSLFSGAQVNAIS